jgi:hypothetical protein
MRRLIANSVLLVILGTFFAPALTSVASPPVPLCCRRGGMHHCAMMTQMLLVHCTSVYPDNPCPMRRAPQLGPCSIGIPVSGFAHSESYHQALVFAGITGKDFSPVPPDNQRAPPAYLL